MSIAHKHPLHTGSAGRTQTREELFKLSYTFNKTLAVKYVAEKSVAKKRC